MMGRHHAVFAGACWAPAAAALYADGQVSLPAAGASLLVAAGAGLFPDFDEPGSSAPRSFGFIGRGLAHLVRVVACGHRGATHTVECVALVALATWLATRSPVAVGVVCGLLVAAGSDALPDVRTEHALLIGVGVGFWCSQVVEPGEWWPAAAVAVGWLAHLVGDTLTPHGVPWTVWRLRKRCVSVRLFTTGSPVESLVVWPLVLVLGVVAWRISGLSAADVAELYNSALPNATGAVILGP